MVWYGTVPTFNSCTKCVSSTGIIYDSTSDCLPFPGHNCMDELKTEHTFDSQATWVINVLGLFY